MTSEETRQKKAITLLAVAHCSQYYLSWLQEVLFDESDESSEEEEQQELTLNMLSSNMHPREREIPRCQNFFEFVVPRFASNEFQSHFRITPPAFEALCRHLVPKLKANQTGRPLKNVEKQILSVIWLLATPDSYRSIGTQFDLGKASVSDAFKRIIKAVNEIAPFVIKWPSNEDVINITDKFKTYAGMDGVIGAVDGTYIPIKAPKTDAHVYITRKHNYAFTLQCIAEPSLKFIDSYIAYPGSVSDNRIFRNSPIYQLLREQPNILFNNTFIIGDKAYPLLEWCIPPYIERQRLTPQQTHFNTVHAKTRQVIERSFALLFGRFRRLKYLDMNRTDLIPATVNACCVLHNICLDHSDLLVEEYIREGYEFLIINEDDHNIGDFDVAQRDQARTRRDNMSMALFNRCRR